MAGSVLFIGGTGTISWWCVRAALEVDWDVWVLNRGQSTMRPLPDGAQLIRADVTSEVSMAAAVRGRRFNVVVDFLSYTPARLERNIELLGDSTDQYIFISSASAYQKPLTMWPITEATPLVNPFWQYSRDKIACEEAIMRLHREAGFPCTIVRPSHTYDAGMFVTLGGWTDILRMREGRPVIVPGDGTSLWTLTHARDFAAWFTALLGERRALGSAFHITGDEVLTWDAIYLELAAAAGVGQPHLVHVASETIGRLLPDHAPDLLGDKSHCVFFDNSRVRSLAPGVFQETLWAKGAHQIVAFHDSHPRYAVRDGAIDQAFDQLAQQA
ncbi:MAG: NAD-dependent epimerase/dehydratase family protein [Micrococcales bacterium]|nr:NAD-dependent epimerase/dehydratase family protein [Micrococcales bacterium]